jgi:hypothetical protein
LLRNSPAGGCSQTHLDVREAKAELREVLERLAERHGIPQKDVTYALEGYADDMLSDLVYNVGRDLERLGGRIFGPRCRRGL